MSAPAERDIAALDAAVAQAHADYNRLLSRVAVVDDESAAGYYTQLAEIEQRLVDAYTARGDTADMQAAADYREQVAVSLEIADGYRTAVAS